MKDELISFKTAKLAEEKGFEEYCKDYYTEKGAFVEGVGNYNGVDNDKVFSYSAPTQSLLQRWLREIHGINITIFTSVENNISGYTPKIHGKLMWKHCKSYELALEEALQEALKLIENKK